MERLSTRNLFSRMDAVELGFCLSLNRWSSRKGIERLFRIVSRLGNGIFWYALIPAVAVTFGARGREVALLLLLLGAVNTLLYKILKTVLARPRPYLRHQGIRLREHPLDLYSFPSGHTLHAAAFTLYAALCFPPTAPITLPFFILVALSRVVLGLHYISDVIAGAFIGAGTAFALLSCV